MVLPTVTASVGARSFPRVLTVETFADEIGGREVVEREEEGEEEDHGDDGAWEAEGRSIHGLFDQPNEDEEGSDA